MKKVGIGIIGCSNRINNVIKKLMEQNKGVEIVALCDPDRDNLERIRDNYCPDAVEYKTDAELVKANDIDWVVIGTWNSLHASQVIMALQAGKHVFCEKPMATTLKDSVALQKVHENCDQKLMVGFTLRYSMFYRKLKEVITSGKIGDIISFEFNETLDFNHGGHIMSCWRAKEEITGSHMLEKCCHDMDLANWLIDSLPAKVASFGGLDFFKPENEFHMTRLKNKDDGSKPFCSWHPDKYHNPFITEKNIIDNQVVIMQYQNGVKATFHTNLCAGLPERRFYILGTEGAVRFDLIKGEMDFCRIGHHEEIEKLLDNDNDDIHGGGDDILVDYWQKMMLEDAPSISTLRDGLNSAVTCFAIEDARKSGSIVDMSPYWDALS